MGMERLTAAGAFLMTSVLKLGKGEGAWGRGGSDSTSDPW